MALCCCPTSVCRERQCLVKSQGPPHPCCPCSVPPSPSFFPGADAKAAEKTSALDGGGGCHCATQGARCRIQNSCVRQESAHPLSR